MHKQLQPYAEKKIDGGDKVLASAICLCVGTYACVWERGSVKGLLYCFICASICLNDIKMCLIFLIYSTVGNWVFF